MNTVRPGLVLRNSILNLATQGILLLLALWGIPILTGGLGEEGFGILAILWAIVGYFSLLDFGTSRAVTKFVAEGLGKKDLGQVKRSVWAGLSFSAVIGVLTGVLIMLATPLVVPLFAGVDEVQISRISGSFYIAASGIPFMLVFGGTLGIFMAHQSFGAVNAFRAALGVLQWGGSVILVWRGFGFFEIILLTVAVRAVVAAAAFLYLRKNSPEYFVDFRVFDREQIRKLLSFGGWVTVSQVISPMFLYADRFLIGSLVSISAVAFYALPQEALSRLSIIPMSLTMTLFPALSQQQASGNERDDRANLYVRSMGHLFHIVLPIIVLLILFASEILDFWVGPTYRDSSTLVFQIIAAGFLFNTMAQLPVAGLHALGRPDITAKFHLLELPVVIGLNLIVIPLFGIVGSAFVWCGRVLVDAILLGGAMHRLQKSFSGGMRTLLIQLGATIVVVAAVLQVESIDLRIVLTVVLLTGYAVLVWTSSVDRDEKEAIKRSLRSYVKR